MQSRQSTAAKVQQDTSAVLIHPYNDGRIIRYILFERCLDFDYFFLSYGLAEILKTD